MRNMQADWDAHKNDKRAWTVFGNTEESTRPPHVREIWFEAAWDEMRVRKVIPHQTDAWVALGGSSRISIGCGDCEGQIGWKA